MPEPTPLIRMVVQGAAFVLVLALWIALVLLWQAVRARREQRIHSRLGISRISGGEADGKVLRLWHEGGVAETTVEREARPTLMQRVAHMGEDAGWKVSMPALVGVLVAGAAGLSVLLLAITGNFVLPALAPVLLLLAFNGYLQYCINKRTALFERQLVDAMELGARSLRAGHPLSGSFRLISEEIAEPVGLLFGGICEQEMLGVSVQDALEQSAAQSRSPDMKIFAVSVVIQLRSGGNLANMMERVTWVIRERMRLNRRARVLTAEAQLSKWVLLALPILLFLGLSLMRPEYMQPLYSTSAGRIMLLVGTGSLLIGSWLMNRMSVLRY